VAPARPSTDPGRAVAASYGMRFAPFVTMRTVPELSGVALPGA
jgi:hypothetical protein